MKLLFGTVICIMPYAYIFELELECCELGNCYDVFCSIYTYIVEWMDGWMDYLIVVEWMDGLFDCCGMDFK